MGKQVRPKPNQANLPARWSKLNLFKDILLGPRLKLVIKWKVGHDPNLLTKRNLLIRLSMELSKRMATSNPRGKLNLPLTKIINKCRSLLTRIISNSTMHL